MSQNYKTATIFGGTGFIGRQIVRDLANLGYIVKIATRIPEKAYFLKPCGAPGQIVPVACNYTEDSIENALKGSDCVINCIGILYQKKKNRFKTIHTELPDIIGKICAREGTKRLIHISALTAQTASSQYAKTKQEGEEKLRAAYPKATILRPSVVFGEDDSFFNMFAKLAGISPILPLIGGGHTKFQPVYVGDVATAAIKAITLPTSGQENPEGQTYELGGPEILTFKEIYKKLFYYTKQPRPLMSLPWSIAKLEACFLSLLPKPLLTPDQVESLKTNTVVEEGAKTLETLGITPTNMDTILPTYLKRYRPGGKFAGVKRTTNA